MNIGIVSTDKILFQLMRATYDVAAANGAFRSSRVAPKGPAEELSGYEKALAKQKADREAKDRAFADAELSS